MLSTFFHKYKKGCLITATIVGTLFIGLYLAIVFWPGYWYDDVFLSRQADGSFAGTNSYASYQMEITYTNNSATITFTANGLTKEYQVTGTSTGHDVYIYKDGSLFFHGQALSTGDDDYMLISDDNSLDIQLEAMVGNSTVIESVPDAEELFPSATWLYNCTATGKTDTLGAPIWLMCIGICVITLILDIKYPDLFFTLRYRHYVDGGTPSVWYRDGQNIGRVALVIAILFCIVRSFYPL